jgi:tRNA threonylcarbamoyladenosine biosynthesis protein TsaE
LECYFTACAQETEEVGKSLSKVLPVNAIVALFGDLGSGKTTLIRGLVQGFGTSSITSPTFTFLNIYDGEKTVYHFDLYRLPKEEEFVAAGFDEHFTAGGICCIEWAEKIPSLLPQDAFNIHFTYLGNEKRKIEISRGKQ